MSRPSVQVKLARFFGSKDSPEGVDAPSDGLLASAKTRVRAPLLVALREEKDSPFAALPEGHLRLLRAWSPLPSGRALIHPRRTMLFGFIDSLGELLAEIGTLEPFSPLEGTFQRDKFISLAQHHGEDLLVHIGGHLYDFLLVGAACKLLGSHIHVSVGNGGLALFQTTHYFILIAPYEIHP